MLQDCFLRLCVTHTMFVPQTTQATSNAGLLHPKANHIQSNVIKRNGSFLALKKTEEKKWCGEGAGEFTLQLLQSMNKTICATGTFYIHASDTEPFVQCHYQELRTRNNNKLCCQSDTSGEIPTYICVLKASDLTRARKLN